MKIIVTKKGELRFEEVTGNEIKFRHCDGVKSPTNKYGSRSFCLQLTDDQAEELMQLGWRIKLGKEKEDGTRYPALINIVMNYESDYWRPKNVTRYSSRGQDELTVDTVKDVNKDEIESAYIIVRPKTYKVADGGDGLMGARLVSMRYKLEEDPYADVYADLCGGRDEGPEDLDDEIEEPPFC